MTYNLDYAYPKYLDDMITIDVTPRMENTWAATLLTFSY